MKNYKLLTVKLYDDDDSRLNQLVAASSADKSAFVRSCIFSDKIIILDKANCISRSLIEISDTLRSVIDNEKLSNKLLREIFSKLCEIANEFVNISAELTSFKAETEESTL